MQIVLGSASKRKLQIAQTILKEFYPDAKVQGKEVSSGVSETPYDQETKMGAKNRAKQVQMLFPDSDFAIGIESGLVKRYGDLYEEAWACVMSKSGESFFGYSSGLKIPESIIREMKKGTAHADLMNQFDEQLGIKTKDTWGSYSGKLISRDVSLQEALRNALIQIKAGDKSFYKMPYES